MTKTKILSVGGGWVSNNRHIPSLLNSGLFDLIGIVSKHPDRAEKTARRFNVPHHATELDFSSAWQQEAEAVMIGSTPHTHYELARAALEAGKHVLSEKPLTINPEDIDKLKQLAESRKRVLAVVHNFQFSEASHRFRRLLASGSLGRIQAIYGAQMCNHARNIHDWCDQLPLGLFFDEAPHFYYMLRWLGGGELELLDATVWKNPEGKNTPAAVTGQYRSATIAPIFLHLNFASSITEWHITVVCENATVDLDLWRDIFIYLPNDKKHRAMDITRTSVYATFQHLWGVWIGGLRYLSRRHLYGNPEVARRFHAAIHGEDSLQGMDPAEGRRVVEMMHELIAKARYYELPNR